MKCRPAEYRVILSFYSITKEGRRASGLCGKRPSKGKSTRDRPDPPDKLLPLTQNNPVENQIMSYQRAGKKMQQVS
ncbi:hypothetical protein [Methanosarcina sp. A14]|uniref:Uncharacterized protein n=1 Tax=Methanosarcina barkeri MS TaxID=1434108 RepID=A0A0E3QYQ3_METBA|nr:hypothetical protein [Methanosarcina sp. A14]AKB56010.1 hypothetical protein MSBRM_3012 [Methanosarcina barkeri MS]